MKRGFDVKKMKIISDKAPSVEEVLSSDKTPGLDISSEVPPNAELEGKEYLSYPDGEIQEPTGDSHDKNGVKMNLPDGTRVLSASVKLGAKVSKEINGQYNVRTKPKDTYATALTKIKKKTGITELEKEQEGAIIKLKEQSEKMDENTSEVNKGYLSKKINDLENQKTNRDEQKKAAFDYLFERQEKYKPSKPTETTMKYGGTSMADFDALCKKHGISSEKGMQIMQFGGITVPEDELINYYTPQSQEEEQALRASYEEFSGTPLNENSEFRITKNQYEAYQQGQPISSHWGAEVKPQRKNFSYLIRDNKSGTKWREVDQSTYTSFQGAKSRHNLDASGFPLVTASGGKRLPEGSYIPMMEDGGKIGGEEWELQQRRQKFSDEERVKQTKNEQAFGNITTSDEAVQELYSQFPDIVLNTIGEEIDGKIVARRGIDFSQPNDAVREFQRQANKREEESAKVIIDNPDVFGQDIVQKATDYLNTETFKEDESVRGYDGKLGNFTSGRFLLGLNVLTPEDMKKASDAGITTFNALKDKAPELGFSPETLERIKTLGDLKGDTDSDFFLGEFTPPTEVSPSDPADPTAGITDVLSGIQATQNRPSGYIFPDQSVLPPGAMEPHLKTDMTFGRIDPIKIGVENNLQELADQREFIASQVEGLPINQRAAVLANSLGQTTKAANEAISNANMVNAENQSNAELFNIGQQTREQASENQSLMGFEQRQFLAKAKTEEDLRNYLDFNRKVALNNYQNQQTLQLMDQLFPNFSVDPFMNQTNFEEDGFQLRSRNVNQHDHDEDLTKNETGNTISKSSLKYGGLFKKK